jgi:phosphate transport system protein
MAIRAVKAQATENQFNSLLVTMGLNVDEAVGKAIAALLHSNSHIVAGVMVSAVAIQELELKLDQAVFSELERCDLPRSEVRRLTSIVNISKDLARLGKLAANLGRKVTEVGKHNDHEDFSRLQPLAIAVSHLCRQTLRSLTHQDLVLARNAAAGSASVDAYRDYVLRNLSGQRRAANEQDDLHLIFASRCLEQIADHTAHLAESLVDFLSCEHEPKQSHSMAS